MTKTVQWIRSFLFVVIMYLALPIYGLIYAIPAIRSAEGAVRACHAYASFVKWLAAWLLGLRTEVRGTPPTGEVLVAAKHQSFFDVIMIYTAVPWGKFIMKALLKYAPVFGQFTMRLGCIPVERGKRGAAIKKMLEDVKSGKANPGQVIIYPQGTRVAPGDHKPYKMGTAALYAELGQPCVPVATNVGVFWPKRGILRKPGVAVIEFMDPIEPGMEPKAFMAHLEEIIETKSNELVEEARKNV